jgi:hypothetical protein
LFKVFVDDNFHYMDESERYQLGEFLTLEEAIAASRKIVDEYLLSAYQPGMTAESLYQSYVAFGEDPFILAVPGQGAAVLFSAWEYAKQRCQELCQSV